MRKVLVIAGILVACLIVAAGALLMFVDVNQYRPQIQAEMQKRLHRDVSLGAMSLKIIPLSIRIDDASIGDAPEFGSQAPFVSAKQMYVSVSLPALLARQIEVNSLRIVQPQVQLIMNRQGTWNFQTLSSGKSTSTGGSSESTGSVAIGEVLIQDGTVAVTDQRVSKGRNRYDHIDITLRDFAPGKHFNLDGQIHLPGSGKELVSLKANGSSLADATGMLSLQTVSLAGLRAFLGTSPAQLSDIVLNGDTNFQSQGDVLSGKSSISINDTKIKQQGYLDFQFRDDRKSGVFDLTSATAKLGAVTATGRAQANLDATPQTIDAEVNTDNSQIAEFLRLAAIFGASSDVSGSGTISLHMRLQGTSDAPHYSGSGAIRNAWFTMPELRKPFGLQNADLQFAEDHVNVQNLSAGIGTTHLHGSASVKNFKNPELGFTADIDKIDVAEAQNWTTPSSGKQSQSTTSSSKPLNGAGTVSIGKIVYNDLVVTNVKADCKMDQGVIRLSPLTAKLFGGTEAGSITADTRANPPTYTIQTKLANIDVNQALSATSAVKNIIYGSLSGNADLQLTSVTGQEIARGLNGNLQMLITSGKISGVSVLNEAAKIGRFLGYTITQDNVTHVSKLSGTLNITNGVANTNDLQTEFDGGSMSGAGVMNLADETLNLKVTTILAKDTSQRAGSRIGGLMSTVLANSKGELVVPAVVKGTFAKPQFEPDTGQIAKMKLAGLLPTKDNPAGAVSKVTTGLIGAFTGNKQAGSGNATAPADQVDKTAQGVQNVLDAFKKKK